MDGDNLFHERALDDVWLHSVHFARSAADQVGPEAEPLVPVLACEDLGSTTKQTWDQKLKSIALLTVQRAGLQGEDSDDGIHLPMTLTETSCHTVQLSNMELQVVTEQQHEKAVLSQIPLTLSDVVWAAIPDGGCCENDSKFVVAVSPRPDGAKDKMISHSNTALSRKVWVLCVGGKYHQEGLQELLFSFASRGAVRWDLDGCYRISQQSLGEGSCGVVFLGKSIVQVGAAQVAVKLSNASQNPEDEDKSFRNEISCLAQVGGHPNVSRLVGVYCFFEEKKSQTPSMASSSENGSECKVGGTDLERVSLAGEQPRWAIALELCPHGDLFDYLCANRALEKDKILQLTLSVLSALSHIHAHEVVHRDIKAENMLIANGFCPVLADFGLAAHLHDAEAMKKQVGSPGYAAPEVLQGKPYDSKVDVFGTGATLYFATCDLVAFEGSDEDVVLARTLRCKVRFPAHVLRGRDRSLLELIRNLLSKDPKERPSAIHAFAATWGVSSENTRSSATVRAAAEAMNQVKSISAMRQVVDKKQLKPDGNHKPQPASNSPQQAAQMQNVDFSQSWGVSTAASEVRDSASSSTRVAQKLTPFANPQESSDRLPSPVCMPLAKDTMSQGVILPAMPGSASPDFNAVLPMVPDQAPPMLLLQRPMSNKLGDNDVAQASRTENRQSASERERESVPEKMMVPQPPESATRRLSTTVSRIGRRLLRPFERAFKRTSGSRVVPLDRKLAGNAGSESAAPVQAPCQHREQGKLA